MFIFLTLNWLFIWEINGESNILQYGEANLIPFFKLSPLIFLILIPAITMKSFSEEKRTGTIELLFTKPITDFQILIAKFLAGVTLVIIALLPTFVYYISVHLLGDPVGIMDDGATITSYLGLMLLGSAFVAIGLFTSSFTKSQIVSYIIAVSLCWVLYDGLGLLASFEKLGSFDFVIDYIGMSSHYDGLQLGVVDTKDVVYFISLIVLFIVATGITINRNKGIRLVKFGIIAVILVFLNIISVFQFRRIDFTEDQKYSLSDSTIEFLESDSTFNEPVFFKIYLDGELPKPLKEAQNSIKEKLDQFRIYAGDKIQYEFIDPKADPDPEEQQKLVEQIHDKGKGIQPLDYLIMSTGKFSNETYWPGAVLNYKDEKTSVVQFISVKQIKADEDLDVMNEYLENNLEFQIVNAINKIVRERKKRIAFLQGHDELNAQETQVMRSMLSENYIIEDVEIDGQIHALDSYDGLIVAQPKKPFNEKDKFVIDQFIMDGGRTMWFINPLEVNLDSLRKRGETYALAQTLNIQDQLFSYGVRIEKEVILQENCSYEYIPFDGRNVWKWPFYINVKGGKHKVSQNIDPIKLDYASPITFVGYDTLVKDTVLMSDPISLYRKPPIRINLNYAVPDMSPFNEWNGEEQTKPIAGMMEGKFKSLYKDRLAKAFTESEDFNTKEISVNNKIFVMGDANFMVSHKPFWSSKTNEMKYFGIFNLRYLEYERRYLQNPPAYGNLGLLMNTVDYMMDDQAIADSRNKGILQRKLDKTEIKESSRFWKLINIIIPLIIITVISATAMIFRRIKYSKK